MNIHEATRGYDAWMRWCTPIVETDLRAKHAAMRGDAFAFFRGTYYRWAQHWPVLCAELCRAPSVLAVGDLHVGSYGTWRDAEGRLAWGVDDFDESYPLPYTNDLVRLAASVKIVLDRQVLGIRLREGCDAILEGYRRALVSGGRPFILAEHSEHHEKLGLGYTKPTNNFWDKFDRCRSVHHGVPSDASRALRQSLPHPSMEYRIVRRVAGVGSRGQQRFVAIAESDGGRIAREAKAMVPSASRWLHDGPGRRESYYEEVLKTAVRSHDPFQRIRGRWLIRRLDPDSQLIDIMDLPKQRDEARLLHAMGAEAANVHLGSTRAVSRILSDLRRRNAGWLRTAAKTMASAVEHDWRQYV